MLKSIEIENYKSIVKVQLPLGRVNVFIGENGAGKSNLLEAIALAGAANAGKLDNEFLTSRGVRITQPQLMRPAFEGSAESDPIKITVSDNINPPVTYVLRNDNGPYTQWHSTIEQGEGAIAFKLGDFTHIISQLEMKDNIDREKSVRLLSAWMETLRPILNDLKSQNKLKRKESLKVDKELSKYLLEGAARLFTEQRALSGFVIYSPENSALRIFEREGQIEPLGINGEGLLKLLSVMSESDPKTLEDIKKSLKVLGWFEGFQIVHETGGSQDRMEINDMYLESGKFYYDQRSANEGFLFIAFYFALFASNLTPKFFAVDNIDASLNPKLCERLTKQLVDLAVAHDKQVLLTTHNPAVLDGLNIDDESQRLFIVSRGANGQTRVRRFRKPQRVEGASPLKLSEAFMRGSLGGLPNGF